MKGLLWIGWMSSLAWSQPASWNALFERIRDLPSIQQEQAKRQQLEADHGRLRASYHPRVSVDATASGTTNPVGVFAGKLGNGEFEMEDFAAFLPDGSVDTFAVNHPDAFYDAVIQLQAGYRIWDGGARHYQGQQLMGLMDAQDLKTEFTYQQLLADYAVRRLRLDVAAAQAEKAEAVVEDTTRVVALVQALVEEGQLPELSQSMAESTLAHAEAVASGLGAIRDASRKSMAAWLDWPVEQVEELPLPPVIAAKRLAEKGFKGESFAERAAQTAADAMEQGPKSVTPYWKPLVDSYAAYESHQFTADNWSLGVKASWKLWDGKETAYRKARRQAEANQARAAMGKARRDMEQARVDLTENLGALQVRIDALGRAVDTARRAWRNHLDLLAEGQLEQGTVFEVRRQLLELEQQLIAATGDQQSLCWKGLLLTGADLETFLKSGGEE